jgi:Hydantoin racemase
MKLCWIHPTARNPAMEGLWTALDEFMPGAMASGCQIETRFLPRSAGFTRSMYAEHLNSVLMVEAALEAQAEGYDGIFLGCWNDPLWEAREVLSIPVASVGEQSILAALAMGHRFAVITVSEKTAVAIERDLIAYGLTRRAIHRPVRAIRPASDMQLLLKAVEDPSEEFIPRLESVAQQCIEDGAEVILVGCAYYGPLLRKAGYTEIPGTGVPVMDTTTVALKYLESMVGIAQATGLVKSRAGMFAEVPQEPLQRARNALFCS